MTDEEKRVLEKWKRRAKLFQQAFREAEGEALNLKIELAQQTDLLQGRIKQLEARLN